MNTSVKLYSLLAVAMLSTLFTSCSNSEEQHTSEEPNLIRINALHPSQTRATETGFEKGDEIGIFVTAQGATLQPFGNSVNNGKFTFDGSQWNPVRKYYWNEGTHDVYAYYPSCATVDDTENFSFKVKTDQSEHSGYTAGDFLCAKTGGAKGGNSPVNLSFKHVLSRAIVELVKGEDYEGELPKDIKVFLLNTVTTANINLATGSTVKDGYADTESIRMKKIAADKFDAVVVPQRIDTRRPLVEVIMGNISYLMEGTISFRQGFQQTLTITIAANPRPIRD